MSDTGDGAATPTVERAKYQNIGLVLGPLVFLLILLTDPPAGLGQNAWLVVAVALFMAVWWATEAIPVPATSLLPMILLPVLDITSLKAATLPYSSPVIYLLLGGFIVAMALARWNLHRRIALNILVRAGDHPAGIIGGFMFATALISMWVSNTAAAMMMLPIVLSVAAVSVPADHVRHPFTVAMLLGVAYSASIGGLGTLVGTPPNALVAGFMAESYGVQIGFAQWLLFGLPMVFVMVPVAWFVLVKIAFPLKGFHVASAQEVLQGELVAMGSLSRPERRVLYVFCFVASAWVFRPVLQGVPGLANLSDTGIAIIGALLMFMTPSGSLEEKGSFLLDWETAQKLPWGVLLLFGGGLSLAAAISASGLAEWLGDALSVFTVWHKLVLILALVTVTIFLTELTSNTATTAAFLPVLGAIAAAADFNPMMLAAPAALAASCAFMLPVATAPNAIVYGSGQVSIPQMARAGFGVNIIGIFVISFIAYLLVPLIFG